jgi:thiamine transporter
MVPIILVALRHGAAWGIICAFVYSNTQLILGLSSLAWIPTVSGKIFCVLFDFIIAFGCLGLAGFFKPAIDRQALRKNKIILISAAVMLVCALRYISHNISAMVVWYGLFGEPGENLLTYIIGTALGYNAAYMIPEMIISLASVPAIITVLSAIKIKRTA